MSNKVLIRRSAVSSNVPTTAQLDLGELAINTYDGKLFLKKDNGTESIVEIGAGGSSGPVEGTSVLSTSVPAGYVLTADGDDTSSWKTSDPWQASRVIKVRNSGTESVAVNTPQVITFDNIEQDVYSEWDTNTSRYTTTVPGWYLVNLNTNVTWNSGSATYYTSTIRRNGSGIAASRDSNTNDIFISSLSCSTVVYLNGDTDYIDCAVYLGGGSSPSYTIGTSTTFTATLIPSTPVTSISTMSSPRACRVQLTQNQTLTTSAFTANTGQSVVFDTGNDWDTTNNYFKPSVAGYYDLSAFVTLQPSSTVTCWAVRLLLNGTTQIAKHLDRGSDTDILSATCGTKIYLNGSTDYIQVQTFTDNTAITQNDANGSYFVASLITGDQTQGSRVIRTYNNDSAAITPETNQTITFDNIETDDAGDWSIANDRFQPTIAGHYNINLNLVLGYTSGTADYISIALRKNGTEIAADRDSNVGSSLHSRISCSTTVYMNGTTDYVYATVIVGGGSSPAFYVYPWTSLSAFLVPSTSGTPGITTTATGEAIIIDENNDITINNKFKLGDYTIEEDGSGNLLISHLTTKIFKLYDNGDLDISGSINTSQTIT